jgi:hypothetical protein
LDGLSPTGLPYRIFETPNSTWLYAESFLSQATAQQFCRAAGGTLAVPVTAIDRKEVFTLLNETLTPGAWNQFSTDPEASKPSTPPSDSLVFGVWMGMRLAMQGASWHTMAGNVVNPPIPWAPRQPVGDLPCAVLRWNPDGLQAVANHENASYWPNNAIAWEAFDCDSTVADDLLPALCKLPAASVPQLSVPYHAGSVTATPYGGLKRLARTPKKLGAHSPVKHARALRPPARFLSHKTFPGLCAWCTCTC